MKMYQIDLHGCPEFIKANNLEEAEKEAIQHIAIREWNDEDEDIPYCDNPSCLVQGCNGKCEE